MSTCWFVCLSINLSFGLLICLLFCPSATRWSSHLYAGPSPIRFLFDRKSKKWHNKFGPAKRQMCPPPSAPSVPLRALHAPHHPLPPPLAVPSPTVVENTRFRAFKKKRVTDGWTDGWTNGQTDPPIEMRGRILSNILSRPYFSLMSTFAAYQNAIYLARYLFRFSYEDFNENWIV